MYVTHENAVRRMANFLRRFLNGIILEKSQKHSEYLTAYISCLLGNSFPNFNTYQAIAKLKRFCAEKFLALNIQ